MLLQTFDSIIHIISMDEKYNIKINKIFTNWEKYHKDYLDYKTTEERNEIIDKLLKK